jgi:hypothetical protein
LAGSGQSEPRDSAPIDLQYDNVLGAILSKRPIPEHFAERLVGQTVLFFIPINEFRASPARTFIPFHRLFQFLHFIKALLLFAAMKFRRHSLRTALTSFGIGGQFFVKNAAFFVSADMSHLILNW